MAPTAPPEELARRESASFSHAASPRNTRLWSASRAKGVWIGHSRTHWPHPTHAAASTRGTQNPSRDCAISMHRFGHAAAHTPHP